MIRTLLFLMVMLLAVLVWDVYSRAPAPAKKAADARRPIDTLYWLRPFVPVQGRLF